MSDPVRIAFVITELDEGGAERALVQIVTRLDRDRWEPRVFSLAGRGPLTATLEDVEIPVFDCGATSASNPLDIWRAYASLKRELTSWQPQIVQTLLFHANLLGRLAAWRAHVPHVLSGIRVADRRGRLRLRLDRWTERFVEKHVCVSQAVADFSIDESGLDPGKVLVIPNGVDLAAFRDAEPVDLAEFGIPVGAKVVLSVGRLDPQKDPLTLLAAFERVAQRIENAHLLLVGRGPMESEIRERIAGSESGARIHLAGWQEDVPGILKAADVFALASRFEGMPNAVLEAGAAGVPVVATAAEGVAEILENGESGWLVGIGDASQLGVAIGEALTHGELAAAKPLRLQSVVAEKFTWESVVSEYDRLYRSLLEAAAPRG
ncbi:MAG: glycosyltransferase [Planctomycetota bacterium]|nr:glycosyltransferase [Planctomycetota bacterium]